MKYYLGLGSNLGNPAANLTRALRLLQGKGLVIGRASSVYRTEPVGGEVQPWFLNQVVETETERSPWELLHVVKDIESRMKRRPNALNGPRVIDIDILLAEETVVHAQELTVPHPRLAGRNFALVPLAEIAPDAVHPEFRTTIRELLRRSKDPSRVEKISPPGRPMRGVDVRASCFRH